MKERQRRKRSNKEEAFLLEETFHLSLEERSKILRVGREMQNNWVVSLLRSFHADLNCGSFCLSCFVWAFSLFMRAQIFFHASLCRVACLIILCPSAVRCLSLSGCVSFPLPFPSCLSLSVRLFFSHPASFLHSLLSFPCRFFFAPVSTTVTGLFLCRGHVIMHSWHCVFYLSVRLPHVFDMGKSLRFFLPFLSTSGRWMPGLYSFCMHLCGFLNHYFSFVQRVQRGSSAVVLIVWVSSSFLVFPLVRSFVVSFDRSR